jgi:hypothetical protein
MSSGTSFSKQTRLCRTNIDDKSYKLRTNLTIPVIFFEEPYRASYVVFEAILLIFELEVGKYNDW